MVAERAPEVLAVGIRDVGEVDGVVGDVQGEGLGRAEQVGEAGAGAVALEALTEAHDVHLVANLRGVVEARE